MSGQPQLSRRDLLLKAALVPLVPLASSTRSAVADAVFPGQSWQGVDPARAGWSMQGLQEAQRTASEIGSSVVMIIQDGRVVAAWGDGRRKIEIHSMRKSMMSALYGIAHAAGRIDLNRTLAQLGIDDRPPRLSPLERQATVRDLLMARSGIYHQAAYETKSMKDNRPQRGSHPPNTFWFYNNWDFNALGTILRRATNEDTFVAVERLLARPLQMQDFRASDGRYVYDQVSEHPAYTMKFTARDLARFGWLYLNKGQWNGRQVIPAEWVAESTQPYSHDARPGISYGYLWWVAEGNKQFHADTGPGSISARGAGGQYIIVAPARRIVVVHLHELETSGRLKHGAFRKLLERIFAAAPPPR